ncbi:Ferredoxin--NADP reductase [Polystyrenella longa]|uniref:ferredoxin--NADP(+) reductase n=1 Tax=Polystyrenella longa TaxID=2528007 RepID=A0A518CP33_9PLAN|nr:ferredoxin--NADP reductase [Polystyrenella longa]QDU80982.1 Ferredoxin--NADP reductase [Polystyrenella longa]
MSQELNAILAQRIELSPGLAVIRVVPDGWELDEFTPGQFCVLGLPGDAPRYPGCEEEAEPVDPAKMIKRAYSIASSPLANGYLEIYIVMVPTGALTPRLFELKVGDKLWLGPKITGHFTLDHVPDDKHVLMMGTGTGLAPYLSMYRTKLHEDSSRHFGILHGARHSWELGYYNELTSVARISDRFAYLPSITRPQLEPVPWKGESGYIQDIWARRPFDEFLPEPASPDNTHIFLCGNPSMIITMQSVLEQEGFTEHTPKEPGQIHIEKYW